MQKEIKLSKKKQLALYMRQDKKRLSEMLYEANKTIEVLKCFQPIEEIPLSETITDTTIKQVEKSDKYGKIRTNEQVLKTCEKCIYYENKCQLYTNIFKDCLRNNANNEYYYSKL